MTFSPLASGLLWPLSLLYGVVVRVRALLYAKGLLPQKRLRGTVISVGNLTVGGTGKTPLVLWLAEKFLAQGKRVAILSRGYRGNHGASDEIALMKSRLQNRVLFGVGKDRFAEGSHLESLYPIDLFLLDDGFQHLSLARDVDIVLMDTTRQLAPERLLPAGRLREPLSAMSRADIAVFTRVESAPGALGALGALGRLAEFPVFAAATHLVGFHMLHEDSSICQAHELGAGPFFAFCGIGNPQAFFLDLQRWGIAPVGLMDFPDHHFYGPSDVRRIEQAAAARGAKALVTTEKDAQNLSAVKFATLPVHVCVIDLKITPEDEFLRVIEQKVQSARGVTA
jgi:tetraacyldisaccharide 4'-kinase